MDTLSEEALDAISAATEADTTEEAVEAVNATANVFNNITIDGDGHSIKPYTDETGAVKQCAFYVVADNATIKNIELNGLNFQNYVGGAIYMQTEATDPTTELTLDAVDFVNCSGNKANARNSGGAVYAESHVSDGSGIDANGTPKLNIKDCTFQGCTIKSKTGLGRGGAVAGLQADITIEDSYFADNMGMYGGAVCVFGENSTLTVKNSQFEGTNDATYGGDDIYIFDGYTWQKNKEQRDSSTNATLSGNVYNGADGDDFTAYRVMRASVLGTVDDTVNAIKSYNYGADYEYKGTGSEFAGGHNAVFDTADTNRTAAPVSDSLIKSGNGLNVTGNTVTLKFAKVKKKAPIK